MGTLVLLIIVAGLGVALAVPIMRNLARRRKEQQLRDNPPQMTCLKVRLTAEADKSNIKATHLFERLSMVLPNDDGMIESNENVLHLAYIGKGAGVGRATQIYFLVWCHPELVDRVTLAISESYPDEAEITVAKPKDDPLFQYAEAFRTREAWDLAQQADDEEDEYEDDDE